MSKVLVVEDNPVTRKVVRLALGHDGFQVIEADTGQAALELASREQPDLILQDLMLPDMDGFVLMARLRALPQLLGVPVIAFSGFLSRLEYGRAASAGFCDFVPKPVEPSRLVSVVRSHLPAPPVQHSPSGRGRRLLVVDDDPVQLKLARIVLTNLGFEVCTAHEGAEALELLKGETFDAVLSDVLMPRVDGFRLCAAVRAEPRWASLPVVLLSSNYVEEADREVACRMGAFGLALRTPDLGDAVKTLEQALENASPAAAAAPVGPEYYERVLRQVERQACLNAAFGHRSAMAASLLSLVAGISETLAHRQDLRRVLPDILASLLEASGVSRGALFLLALGPQARDELGSGALAGFEPSLQAESLWVRSHGVLGQVERARVPSVLEPESGDDKARPWLRELHCESALVVPLVANGDCLGMLLLLSNSRDFRDTDWLPFGRSVSVQIGQALGLSQAFTRLAASENRYRQLYEQAGDGIFTLDAAGELQDVNPALERFLGRSRAQLLGVPLHEFFVPGALEGRQRFHLPNGRTVTGEISTRRIEVEGSRLELGIVRDVSERERLEREMELLQSVIVGASQAPDLGSALQQVLALVCQGAEWTFGAAWLPDAGGRRLECSRSWAATPDYDRLTEMSFSAGEGVLGRTWASARPCWVRDLSCEPGCRRSEDAARLGVRAGLAVPVVEGGQVLAILEFFNEGRDEDQRLVQLVTGIAAQVSSILARRRAEEALRKSEQQLRQAQKMEAVGRLAGGVAHDFNNLLCVILGFGEVLLEDLRPDDPVRETVREICQAGHRAAELTRQLLMFSSRQPFEPHVLELNEVVQGVERMLRRILGADVDLTVSLTPEGGRVCSDPTGLEQVLMNLVVNARDAMPAGGQMTLETARVTLAAEYAGTHLEAGPGEYMMVAVSDTGTGMDQATLSRIFEPFFTTKESGKGTGLGLSTVFGIVSANGGRIAVDSEPGRGSTFKVYLPRVEADVQSAVVVEAATSLGGSETILLVEDDPQVRMVAQDILKRSGYRVIVAQNAGEALLLSEKTDATIDLLLTDVVMPYMSGPELAQRLAGSRPEMRVLCMSGYTDDALVRHSPLHAKFAYIQKPLLPLTLLRKLREVFRFATESRERV